MASSKVGFLPSLKFQSSLTTYRSLGLYSLNSTNALTTVEYGASPRSLLKPFSLPSSSLYNFLQLSFFDDYCQFGLFIFPCHNELASADLASQSVREYFFKQTSLKGLWSTSPIRLTPTTVLSRSLGKNCGRRNRALSIFLSKRLI